MPVPPHMAAAGITEQQIRDDATAEHTAGMTRAAQALAERMRDAERLFLADVAHVQRTYELRLSVLIPDEPAPDDKPASNELFLTWYPAASADEENDDQETDLDAIGNPGGASWALVATDSCGPWIWRVYDRWLHEDATTLAGANSGSQEEAQAAVLQRVKRASGST